MGNLNIKLVLFGCAAAAVIVSCDGGNERKTRHPGQGFTSTLNNSLTHADTDIYNWTAPAEMSKNYPYYISGLDEDSRPIFVCEFGKWDVRRILEKGGQEAVDFEKYMEQGFHRFSLGVNQRDLKDLGVTVAEGEGDVDEEAERRDGSILIVDMEGFNFLQVASPQTLRWMLGMAGKLSEVTEKLAYGYFINMNFVGERVMNLARPILGRTMERIEVYGTNSEKWIPRLLRMLPRDQLPPWYGGPKTFAPLVVYG